MRARTAFGAFFVVGAATLLGSIFLNWYVVSSGRWSYALSPLGVQVTSPSSISQTSFSAVGLSTTGELYSGAFVLILSAIGLAIYLGPLAFSKTPVRRRGLMLGLSLTMVACAMLAPTLLAVGQPLAACSDIQGFETPTPLLSTGHAPACDGWMFTANGEWYGAGSGASGPGTSFVGQSGSLSWGPSVGWYLATVGAGMLAIGTALGAPGQLPKSENPGRDRPKPHGSIAE